MLQNCAGGDPHALLPDQRAHRMERQEPRDDLLATSPELAWVSAIRGSVS